MLSLLFLSVSRVLGANILQEWTSRALLFMLYLAVELQKKPETNKPGISHFQNIGSSSTTPRCLNLQACASFIERQWSMPCMSN
jgi:hypothetical protein